MKRVAALWLPNWSIDRICQAEPTLAPPPEPAPAPAVAVAPRRDGWRPGARWARGEESAKPPARAPYVDPPRWARETEPSVRTSPARLPFRPMPPDIGINPQPPQHEPKVSKRRVAPPPPPIPPLPAIPAGTGALVAVHKVGSRVEVAAASPAALALGVTVGMALTQVRASLPGMVVRDADPAGDAAALRALAILLARRWMPTVAAAGPDALFLDLTGVAHLHGGEARLARRLVRLLARAGFAARIAVADTPGAAWALAHHGADAIALCPSGGHRAALANLSTAALRLEPRPLELLRRLGVDRIADVAALPRGPFVRRFGQGAALRLDQALGDVAEPLDPILPPEAIGVSQRFAEPIGSAEAIAHWLGTLTPRLTEALAEAGHGARSLWCVADRIDGVPQTMRLGFARPTRDPAHILRLLTRRIEEIDPGYGIDALHLQVRRSEPLGPQPFHERLDATVPDLAALIDTLANRGAPSWRTAPVASHVPERSTARAAPLDPPVPDRRRPRRDDVRQLDRTAPDHPWHPRRPRPVRLLKRPEPLDHVMAELPDQPPVRFTWRGVRHIVVRADGPERIAGEWWRRSGERDAVRDYFRVEDESGARFWLFRRGDGVRPETGDLSWYLHGTFG